MVTVTVRVRVTVMVMVMVTVTVRVMVTVMVRVTVMVTVMVTKRQRKRQRIGVAMTEKQKKRAEELAKKKCHECVAFNRNANNVEEYITEMRRNMFVLGYAACAKDATVLVEAIELYEDAVKHWQKGNSFDWGGYEESKVKQALTKWRGGESD